MYDRLHRWEGILSFILEPSGWAKSTMRCHLLNWWCLGITPKQLTFTRGHSSDEYGPAILCINSSVLIYVVVYYLRAQQYTLLVPFCWLRIFGIASIPNSETFRNTLQKELYQLLIWVLLEVLTPTDLCQWGNDFPGGQRNHRVWWSSC